MKEHIGDIRAARATGLIEGMAKGFGMERERRKKLDDEEKKAKKTWRLRMARDETDGKRKGREDNMAREDRGDAMLTGTD